MKKLIISLLLIHLVYGSLFPLMAEAGETYWGRPSGANVLHDITGDSTTCNLIRSTDGSHVGVTRASEPSFFGTVGTVVACMRTAGSIGNLSGAHGIYNAGDTRHVINTSNSSITPAFGLTSGTPGNPSIVQTVPGDPRAEIRPPWGYESLNIYTTSPRSYLIFRNLVWNGINSYNNTQLTDQFRSSCVFFTGDHNTLQDIDIGWCPINGIEAHSDPIQGCANNHDNIIQRVVIHDIHFSYGYYGDTENLLFDNSEIYNANAEGTQHYYDAQSGVGCDAADAIFSNNYIHDIHPGTAADTFGNIGKCQGMVFNGSSPKVFNNRLDMTTCQGPTSTSGDGIEFGTGHCISSIDGKFFAWNNTIYNAKSAGIFMTTCGQSQSGSQVWNNLIIGPAPAFSGAGQGLASYQGNITGTGPITTYTVSTTDFHLKTGTNPAVGAGVTVADVTTDFEGTTRSSPYDVGADQRSGGVVSPPASPRFSPGINLRRTSWDPGD